MKKISFPLGGIPELPPPSSLGAAPDDTACIALWDKYDMLPNVRRHSRLVADIATQIALRAKSCGYDISVPHVRASALLHDIAKTYCIKHGGGHAQLGAAWTIVETKNYALAQGVMLHVHWPWELPEGKNICSLPFFVIYADKRVKHDCCVTLDDRYADLIVRYGKTDAAKNSIQSSLNQGKQIENALSALLELNLNACSFNRGRLVQ